MYIVIKDFVDLHDNDYRYHAGDEFPRAGIRVEKSRMNALSSTENRRGIPLIQEILLEGNAEDADKISKFGEDGEEDE